MSSVIYALLEVKDVSNHRLVVLCFPIDRESYVADQLLPGIRHGVELQLADDGVELSGSERAR